MTSFEISQLDLITLKRNSVEILNNTVMIALIAKGTQGMIQLLVMLPVEKSMNLAVKRLNSAYSLIVLSTE